MKRDKPQPDLELIEPGVRPANGSLGHGDGRIAERKGQTEPTPQPRPTEELDLHTFYFWRGVYGLKHVSLHVGLSSLSRDDHPLSIDPFRLGTLWIKVSL